MDKSKNQKKRKLGQKGEQIAAGYLVEQGHSIMETNFYSPYGEIDVISQYGNRYHIVEVKTRSSQSLGFPEEAVDRTKMVHLAESALHYFQEEELDVPWQIDVISIEMQNNQPKITVFENVSID